MFIEYWHYSGRQWFAIINPHDFGDLVQHVKLQIISDKPLPLIIDFDLLFICKSIEERILTKLVIRAVVVQQLPCLKNKTCPPTHFLLFLFAFLSFLDSLETVYILCLLSLLSVYLLSLFKSFINFCQTAFTTQYSSEISSLLDDIIFLQIIYF